MDWIDIETDDDANKLLERVEHFYDRCVAGYSYDPLARVQDDDLNLSRF